jgi:hypothetical protein
MHHTTTTNRMLPTPLETVFKMHANLRETQRARDLRSAPLSTVIKRSQFHYLTVRRSCPGAWCNSG